MTASPAPYAISVFSFLMGVFLLRRPQQAIRLQIAFYKKINWRMEPISMAKEVRNTRVMGLFLMVVAVATLFVIVLKGF